MDYSISKPGLCKFILDNNLDIEEKYYLTMTETKKYERKDCVIHYNTKKDFIDDIERKLWVEEEIFNFLNNCDYVALEGYAFAAKGLIFDIAEGCGIAKRRLYKRGIKLRIYDPSSIKKFATNMGNADKIHMEEDYEKCIDKFDLSFLPMVREGKSGNPKDNVVDAFFICKLLQLELKIRHGLILLKDLDLKKIEIFNKVSKKYPESLLTRSFIERR